MNGNEGITNIGIMVGRDPRCVLVAVVVDPLLPVTPMDIEQIDHLPPTFIVGAGKDKLLRSSQIYAAHLRQRFSPVEYKVYASADHGFFCFGPKSVELSEDIARFLAK